ncbi:MAG: hypothetical protein ACRDQX_07535, partial [Pseudonocardiaceae bacterium]
VVVLSGGQQVKDSVDPVRESAENAASDPRQRDDSGRDAADCPAPDPVAALAGSVCELTELWDHRWVPVPVPAHLERV